MADAASEARARLERLRRTTAALLASFNELVSLLRVTEGDAPPAIDSARIVADTDVMLASTEQLLAMIRELRLDAYFIDEQ